MLCETNLMHQNLSLHLAVLKAHWHPPASYNNPIAMDWQASSAPGYSTRYTCSVDYCSCRVAWGSTSPIGMITCIKIQQVRATWTTTVIPVACDGEEPVMGQLLHAMDLLVGALSKHDYP